ncbi:Lactate utilization protein B [compost metagenome]
MKTAGRLLASQALFGKALRFANPASRLISRHGRIVRGPQLVRGWINARDLSQPVRQQDSFRAWFDKRKGREGQ